MQNKGTDKFLNKKSIKAILFGAVTGIFAVTILFLIAGFGISKLDTYPASIIDYVILAIIFIGGLIAGFVTGRIYKSSGILYGAMTGIVLFLIILFAGISSIADGMSLFTLYKLALLVISSALGGIWGVNKKDKIHIK